MIEMAKVVLATSGTPFVNEKCVLLLFTRRKISSFTIEFDTGSPTRPVVAKKSAFIAAK